MSIIISLYKIKQNAFNENRIFKEFVVLEKLK